MLGEGRAVDRHHLPTTPRDLVKPPGDDLLPYPGLAGDEKIVRPPREPASGGKRQRELRVERHRLARDGGGKVGAADPGAQVQKRLPHLQERGLDSLFLAPLELPTVDGGAVLRALVADPERV